MSNQQIDVTMVLKKLQDKLGDAFTTIAILEAQLEQLVEKQDAQSPEPGAPEAKLLEEK